MDRERINFYIDLNLRAGLRVIDERDGIPQAEQIRRGIKMWLQSKGYRVKPQTRTRKGGKRKR